MLYDEAYFASKINGDSWVGKKMEEANKLLRTSLQQDKGLEIPAKVQSRFDDAQVWFRSGSLVKGNAKVKCITERRAFTGAQSNSHGSGFNCN